MVMVLVIFASQWHLYLSQNRETRQIPHFSVTLIVFAPHPETMPKQISTELLDAIAIVVAKHPDGLGKL